MIELKVILKIAFISLFIFFKGEWMNLSTNTAMIIVFFVTLLWGSWFQTVKHTGKYPITNFIALMYTFSLFIVWISIILLEDTLVPDGVFNEISNHIPLSIAIVICGAVFAIGIQLYLTVVKRIGLILSTSVSATCCILSGTIVSSFFGGIPEGASFTSIIFSSILLVMATIICQYSGVVRDRERGIIKDKKNKSHLNDVFLLVFINVVLISAYPLAISIGIKSPLNLDGMSSLTCVGVLVIGAFIGSNIFALMKFNKEGSIKDFFKSDKKISLILLMATISAFCHFGGNVLHSIASPIISVSIAVAMANSYHVWSYIWGLFYGEFKGAGFKVYLLLFIGIFTFIVGVISLSLNVT